MGLRLVAMVAAGALALGNAPQARGKPANPQQHKTNAIASVAAEPPRADAANAEPKGCPGTQYPRFPCEAISAQAAVEQARQSVRQAELFKIELIISALTALAAIAAAGFAARAASAARDTVRVLSEVERADVIVTVENYSHSNVFVQFDLVAHNLGRSAALITTFGTRWAKTSLPDTLKGFFTDHKHRVVPAAGQVILQEKVSHETAKLKNDPYLWVLINMQAPLDGHIGKRFCFQVFERPMTSHRVTQEEVYSDQIDQNDFHRSVTFDDPEPSRWGWVDFFRL